MKALPAMLLFSVMASAQCWTGWNCLGKPDNATVTNGKVILVGSSPLHWKRNHLQLVNKEMVGSGFMANGVFAGDNGAGNYIQIYSDHHEKVGLDCHRNDPAEVADQMYGIAVQKSAYEWVMAYVGLPEMIFGHFVDWEPPPGRRYVEVGLMQRTADHKKHYLKRFIIDPIAQGQPFWISVRVDGNTAYGTLNGKQFSAPLIESVDSGYAAIFNAVDPAHTCDGPVTRVFETAAVATCGQELAKPFDDWALESPHHEIEDQSPWDWAR